MKYICTSKGIYVAVDDRDYDYLSTFEWSFAGRYAASRIDGKLIYMHRLIMNAGHGITVDHINGDILDNQRCNLRLASQKENSRNQKKHEGNHKYKGVYYRKDTGKWQVKIMVDYKNIGLGCYTNEEIAAVAYDVAARIYFGEFARTNFDWNTRSPEDY